MNPFLYLFDDRIARGWEPFSSSRPAGELFFGALRLRERIERAFDLPVSGYLATPGMEGFDEDGAPGALDPAGIAMDSPRLVVLSRAVFAIGPDDLQALSFPPDAFERGALLFGKGGIPLGWLLPPGVPLPSVSDLLRVADKSEVDRWGFRLPIVEDSPQVQVGGNRVVSVGMPDAYELALPATVLLAPWEIPAAHAGQLRHDLDSLFPGGVGFGVEPLPEFSGVHRIGEAPVSCEPGVVVDQGVVLDTRKGPIHLGARVRISPFTWLKGPSLIGPDSTLLGGTFDSIVCGPVCRLRGEIEESVILGYSNKAHDGYLGHAVVGRWVNFGALTTNSDLKNNYSSIRVGGPDGESDTGLMKLGALLGDHVKLGIGTLLDAGTVVGPGSNVFGGGFPGTKWIPPFSWGGAKGFRPYNLESFLSTAETAMGRRGVDFSDGAREFLCRLWARVHGEQGEGGPEGFGSHLR